MAKSDAIGHDGQVSLLHICRQGIVRVASRGTGDGHLAGEQESTGQWLQAFLTVFRGAEWEKGGSMPVVNQEGWGAGIPERW